MKSSSTNTITSVLVQSAAYGIDSSGFQARGYSSKGAQLLVGLTHLKREEAESDAASMLGREVQ